MHSFSNPNTAYKSLLLFSSPFAILSNTKKTKPNQTNTQTNTKELKKQTTPATIPRLGFSCRQIFETTYWGLYMIYDILISFTKLGLHVLWIGTWNFSICFPWQREKRKEQKRKENFWERSHTIQPLPLNAKAQENTPEVGSSYIVLIKLYIIIFFYLFFQLFVYA